MTPAEQSVLSALLEASGEGGTLVDQTGLEPSQFSTLAGGTLFEIIRDTALAGKPTDPATIASIVSAHPGANGNMTPATVWELAGLALPASAIAHHAGIVAQDAARNRLAGIGTYLTSRAREGIDADQLLADAQDRLANVTLGSTVASEAITDHIDATLEDLDRPVTYAETPWPSLNRYMNGWRKGGLYVIGARPSVGKTVAGLQAALSLANVGPVAYTSLEMGVDELQLRMVSQRARVDMGRIVRKQLADDDMRRVVEARSKWGHIPLYVDPSHDATIAQVARHAWSIKRQHGLAAVVVDYLGLLEGRPGQKEYEVVTEAARKLKLLAKALDVPVIALSQLNRGSEKRDDKRPALSDLRSSGAVEQDADVVVLLHRDIMDAPHEIDLIVAKNRQGTTGVASMAFAGHYSEIRDQ